MTTCERCTGSGYVGYDGEIEPCDHPDCTYAADQERERIRQQIVAHEPVDVDAIPVELFNAQHPGACRKWFGGRRNPRYGMPDPPYTVLTDAQIVALMQRLSKDELARLRARLGMEGRAA